MDMEIATLAENIETLCSVEMRERGSSYGVIRRLYESSREAQKGIPTQLAVDQLRGSVNEGDVVLVATGAYVPHFLPKGETDGPTGAASLAYALRLGIGAVPVLLSGPQVMEPVEASCRALGLVVHPLEIAAKMPFAATVQPFPIDDTAEEAAQELLETLSPKAIIFVETLGVNRRGIAHSSTGMSVMEGRSRLEVLAAAARNAGVFTIGIGDNGNQIGYGMISEAVRQHKPFGRKCRCDCAGGIACVDACDVLITAATSNWGAYGLAACLAGALGAPELIHGSETELRMISACVEAGAVDGATGMSTVSVDGIPGPIHGYLVNMLRLLVTKSLSKRKARPF